jgi:hypothetical protein
MASRVTPDAHRRRLAQHPTIVGVGDMGSESRVGRWAALPDALSASGFAEHTGGCDFHDIGPRVRLSLLDADESELDRLEDRRRSRRDLELAVDAATVRDHSVHREGEQLGDLRAAEAFGEELKDLDLAR